MASLTYNDKTKDYIFIAGNSNDDDKASQVGLTLSKTARTQAGQHVYFTKVPYAALAFWDVADQRAKDKLQSLHRDFVASNAITSDKVYPAPKGLEYMPYQNAGITYGLQHDNVLIGDEPGLGKQQPVYSLVMAPSGWQQIGSIKVGDYVYSVDGKPCRVTGVFPQGFHDSYRLTFRDGTSTECGLEHLWAVKDGNRLTRGEPWAIKTLEELLKWGVTKADGKNKFCIPLPAPLEFAPVDYLIDPYILGVLIGDGSILNGIVFSNPDFDSDIREVVEKRLPAGFTMREDRCGACPRFQISHHSTHQHNPFLDEIRAMELDVKSGEKFIPEKYKFGSVQQRLDLLAGLMDTDGSASKNRITFHTISGTLANDVAELVRSLGGVAIVRGYDRSKEDKPYEYQVNVKTEFNPFYTSRKKKGWWPSKNDCPLGSLCVRIVAARVLAFRFRIIPPISIIRFWMK